MADEEKEKQDDDADKKKKKKEDDPQTLTLTPLIGGEDFTPSIFLIPPADTPSPPCA